MTTREHTLSRYGLSEEDYKQMFAAQEGRCAICFEPAFQTLVVDHCHKTGTVRGLLCGGCNKGLGFFKDQADSLFLAWGYLKQGGPKYLEAYAG